jgi:hypothetical protein
MSFERIALYSLAGLGILVGNSSVYGWCLPWAWTPCGCEKCPPPYIHYQPGPPCLKYKHACPKPVCGPCDLEGWGYYQNCWRPWPWPAHYAHCGAPGPEAAIQPNRGIASPTMPGVTGTQAPSRETLPSPRPIEPTFPND